MISRTLRASNGTQP